MGCYTCLHAIARRDNTTLLCVFCLSRSGDDGVYVWVRVAMEERGMMKPIIDGPYLLNEVPRLIQYFGAGQHQGKVVIALDA